MPLPRLRTGAILLATVSTLATTAPTHAQRAPERFDQLEERALQPLQAANGGVVYLPAFVGSALGLVGGWYLGGVMYDATGCCGGGDDPGLTGSFLLALGVSAAGAALLPASTSDYDVGSLVQAAFIGVFPAAAAAYGTAYIVEADLIGLLAYPLVHAGFVALVAPHL